MKRLTLPHLTGFRDMDEVLLHACFQCLVNYVEKECDGQVNPVTLRPDAEPEELELTEKHNRDAAEVNELYAWWLQRCRKHVYPPDPDQWEKDTQMLHRLIDVRGSMWT